MVEKYFPEEWSKKSFKNEERVVLMCIPASSKIIILCETKKAKPMFNVGNNQSYIN